MTQLTWTQGFSKTKRYPSLATIATYALALFLIYAFFSKMTIRFYASFLFLFYSVIGKMWIAVMCLGVFQTLLLLPLRVINLMRSKRIKEFKDALKETEHDEQQILLKQKIGSGQRIALFYWVNFMVQTVSYVSLGRLFLTDFYRYRLDPNLLYSFVPYPEYPIQSVVFKLPYVWFTNTTDFGASVMWVGIGIVALFQVGLFIWRMTRKKVQKKETDAAATNTFLTLLRYVFGSAVLSFVLMFLLTRYFPSGWRLMIFSGDITRPYPTFNFITAVATAATVLWLNIPKIRTQTSLALASGMPREIVRKTSRDLLRNTLRNAFVIGLGAYFVTNQIPSAFELSIFTLELISWTAPLTLDRVILQARSAQHNDVSKSEADSAETRPKENIDQLAEIRI